MAVFVQTFPKIPIRYKHYSQPSLYAVFLSAILRIFNKKFVVTCPPLVMAYLHLWVQAALVIRGFGIRVFDYSRVRKQGKTTNSKENFMNIKVVLLFKFLRNVTPANGEGNLYLSYAAYFLDSYHRHKITMETCNRGIVGFANPDCTPFWWMGMWSTIQFQKWIWIVNPAIPWLSFVRVCFFIPNVVALTQINVRCNQKRFPEKLNILSERERKIYFLIHIW